MKPKPPIEDYYGTKFEVEIVFKSAGIFVYMDREPTESFLQFGHKETMDRFTPDQARGLAQRLLDAAKEAEHGES